ncbi:unnamed protein product [Rhizoctonia solani]|uniref:Fructose-2,6-bisphosphatase TIGAR n=1 Tax=Rhizoctonia solani TaxID=456999 RepID=A0A8H2Y2R9_9AGAM|nr:unnamed protein product [Rhizoctonia solani]
MYRNLLVYIVRHGETNENRLGIIQGQLDTQLNDAGKVQAELTGRSLKDVNLVRAYSSDSSRASDTARRIVAYHPGCELVLDRRIRERNMGSLSGTTTAVKRPYPPGVETSASMEVRLRDFWESIILPLLSPSAHTSGDFGNSCSNVGAVPTDKQIRDIELRGSHIPAVLLVSHGATISKLVNEVLLQTCGYKLACEMRFGIYNTSISIVRMDAATEISRTLSKNDENGVGESDPLTVSVSGVLLSFASIAHLNQKHDIVVENADILGQGSL